MAASASVCAQDVVKILHLDPPTAPAWVREVLGSEAKEQPAVLRESLVVRLEQSRDASFLSARTSAIRRWRSACSTTADFALTWTRW